MARDLRVEYPGASGCRDDAERRRFVETLEEACVRAGGQVHTFC